MVRRDFGRVLLLWSATVFPVWALIIALMPDDPSAASLIIWWLKPLYDRVPLYHLSRRAFGVEPKLGETLKQWPKLWFRNFLPALLWRRLSFIRSFAMPAQMLEGLRGSAMRKRVKTLAVDGGGSGMMVSYAFLKLEIVLLLSVLFTTYSFLPESWEPDWSALLEAPDAIGLDRTPFVWWYVSCYMIAMTLVEPFYVGAGFGLYLNCRTRIEGWDVELAFRKLAARLTTPLIALVVALSFLSISTAKAEDVAKITEEVLKNPDFEVHKTKSWEWVPDKLDLGNVPKGDFSAIAAIGEILFWTVVIAAAAALTAYIAKNLQIFSVRKKIEVQHELPKVIMGMQITRESLPKNILAAAIAACDAGNACQALSLLYRGSLSWLVTQRRVPIRDSDTEEDCLSHVVKHAPQSEAVFFHQLTGAWIQTAYATLPVTRDEVIHLCSIWPFADQGGTA
ncbi:MAG: DUF4129 domain-containing protein, partial [Prosthecobacter sp.]